MYLPQISSPATPEYPIAQSYVDVCLRGCLSISVPFVDEFIATTVGWNAVQWTDFVSCTSSSAANTASSMIRRPRHHRHSSSCSTLSTVSCTTTDDDTDDDTDGISFIDDDDESQQQQQQQQQPSTQIVWINDRRDPLYMRADKSYSLQFSQTIDTLLVKNLSTMLLCNSIEGQEVVKVTNNKKNRLRQNKRSHFTISNSDSDDDDDDIDDIVNFHENKKTKHSHYEGATGTATSQPSLPVSWLNKVRIVRGKKEIQHLRNVRGSKKDNNINSTEDIHYSDSKKKKRRMMNITTTNNGSSSIKQ
jgi:hypothetical protein